MQAKVRCALVAYALVVHGEERSNGCARLPLSRSLALRHSIA